MKQTHDYNTYILAIGPHPDDVEIGCGGALFQSALEWKSNTIIDLSPSQLSTHGDPTTREMESQCAGDVLRVQQRINLQWEDWAIIDSAENRKELASYIRKHKPEIVMMPWTSDRHPDHEATAQLVKNAVFVAGLEKVEINWLAPHKPRLLLHYMIRQEFEPDFIFNLDEKVFQQKMKAFTCYKSQFDTNSRWLDYVEARHISHGHRIGTHYGEWYKLYSHAVWITNFDSLLNWFF